MWEDVTAARWVTSTTDTNGIKIRKCLVSIASFLRLTHSALLEVSSELDKIDNPFSESDFFRRLARSLAPWRSHWGKIQSNEGTENLCFNVIAKWGRQ